MSIQAAHIAAFSLIVLDLTVRAWKMCLLLPGQGRARPSVWQSFAINSYGDAAAAVTPGRLGGEPARFWGFRNAGVEAGPTVVALAAEKVIDWVVIGGALVLLVIALGGDGLEGLRQIGSRMSQGSVFTLAIVVTLCVVASGITLRWYRRGRHRAAHGPIHRAWAHAKNLPPMVLLVASGLTVISMIARVAVLPVLVLPFFADAPLGQTLLGSFGLLYGQILLPTPAGFGPVELGFALGFAGSIAPGQIAALLVAWRFYTLVLGAALGGVMLARTVVRRRRVWATLGVVIVASLVLSETALAQDGGRGSRNLPVDHWSYEYIQRLRSRGLLSNLNPLVQPYRRAEVAQGLVRIDPDTLPEPIAGWVRLLSEELAREMTRLDNRRVRTWGIQLGGGIRASSNQRFDALRTVGDEDVWPRGTAAGWLETGPVAAETRLLGDTYLTTDPDGVDPGQRRAGRSDNAYVSVTLPFGGVTLGRLSRNWSALGTNGLMVSAFPTPYPQVAFEVRQGRLALRGFTGELETLDDSKRFLSAHRVDYQSGNLVISLGESILYAGRHGLSLRFLNPLEFLFFDINNEPNDDLQNLMLDAQLWYRSGGVVFHLEALLDDLDVIPGDRDPEPTEYGFTIGSRFVSIAPWVELGIEYKQVASFTYRTPKVIDVYSFLDRGLGDNFSDYDQLTVSADLFPPVPGLRLTPLAQIQRQGEGDFRDSVPPQDEFLASPALFLGVKQTTYRIGLRGRFQPNRYVWFAWEVGENFVRNRDHVTGDNGSEFSAIAQLGITVDLPLARRRE